MELHSKTFYQLSSRELYQIAALRMAVFVVEQSCAYQDLDGLDEPAIHLFFTEEGDVVACLRILPQDVAASGTAAIGRVVVKREFRGRGLAKKLMEEGIRWAGERMGAKTIVLRAQEHAVDFYRKCGFRQTSERFWEDNIPHVEMRYFFR